MHVFSQEALDRPLRTVEAAKVLRNRAWAISQVTSQAHEDELVIAVVESDLGSGGIWTIAREEFARQTNIVEEAGGWSLTFEPGTSITDIIERCNTLARQATKRYERLESYMKR